MARSAACAPRSGSPKVLDHAGVFRQDAGIARVQPQRRLELGFRPGEVAGHPEDMAKRCMGGSILGIEFEATPDRRHRGRPRGVNVRTIMHRRVVGGGQSDPGAGEFRILVHRLLEPAESLLGTLLGGAPHRFLTQPVEVIGLQILRSRALACRSFGFRNRPAEGASRVATCSATSVCTAKTSVAGRSHRSDHTCVPRSASINCAVTRTCSPLPLDRAFQHVADLQSPCRPPGCPPPCRCRPRWRCGP